MNNRLTLGGYAAFVCALCYIIGFTMIIFVMPDINTNGDVRLQAILNETRLLQLWYTIIFIVFGFSLLLLNRSLYLPAHQRSGHLQLFGAFIGYVWAAYVFACGLIAVLSIEYIISLSAEEVEQIWPATYAIQMGLGDGSEWFGGFWMLMVNISLYQSQRVSKKLCVLGFLCGIAGCLTLIPGFADAGAVFGLVQILWFIWLGAHLLVARATQQ